MCAKMVPFDEIRVKMPDYAERLYRRYLSKPRRLGDWWIATVPWRVDKNPSFGVLISGNRIGHWRDFGRPGEKGDLIDFIERVEHLGKKEAGLHVAAMMGIEVKDDDDE